jgi:hypothetical protein
VFAASGSYASAAAFSDGFAPALGAAAALALAGAAAGIWLRGRVLTPLSHRVIAYDG